MPAQIILNAANGPKFCSTDAYLHAHILGLGVATTLRYQRLGILYLACFSCINIQPDIPSGPVTSLVLPLAAWVLTFLFEVITFWHCKIWVRGVEPNSGELSNVGSLAWFDTATC